MQLPKLIQRPTRYIVIAFLCTLGISMAHAGPREQAKRIHDRLAGVPPESAVVDSMAAKLAAGDGIGAAYDAMDHPAFYNTTVRELATPWSNREQSVYGDLNDLIATVIGLVRDDMPFDQVLYEDIVYIGTAAGDRRRVFADRQRSLPGPAAQSRGPERPGKPCTAAAIRPAELADWRQRNGGRHDDARLFSEAYLVAGTNRAAIRFATVNFLCMDMEDFRDITAHPGSDSPGRDAFPGRRQQHLSQRLPDLPRGLDGLAGAFAYYDFDEDLQQPFIRRTPCRRNS